MLKANSKKVLDIIATQDKRNAAQAYREVHPQASNETAKTNAYQLLKKPEAQLYLEEHRSLAQRTSIEVLQNARTRTDDLGWQKLASDQAEKILDRTDGKPLTKTHATHLNISLEEALNSLQ